MDLPTITTKTHEGNGSALMPFHMDRAPAIAEVIRRPDIMTLMNRVKERFHVPDMDMMIQRLSSFQVPLNKVLLLTYLKSDFAGRAGLIMKPDKTKDEDKWQGKVGLIVKMGPKAFVNTDSFDFGGVVPSVGDWLVYRNSDGMQLAIDNAHCCLIEDYLYQGIVPDPDSIDSVF